MSFSSGLQELRGVGPTLLDSRMHFDCFSHAARHLARSRPTDDAQRLLASIRLSDLCPLLRLHPQICCDMWALLSWTLIWASIGALPATCSDIGGFEEWRLLEDVDLATRLRRKYGRPAIVPLPVQVCSYPGRLPGCVS